MIHQIALAVQESNLRVHTLRRCNPNQACAFKGLCEQNGDGTFEHYEHGSGDDITVSYSPPRCWFEGGKNVEFHTIVGANATVIDSAARAAEVIVPGLLILVIEAVGLGLWWRGRQNSLSSMG